MHSSSLLLLLAFSLAKYHPTNAVSDGTYVQDISQFPFLVSFSLPQYFTAPVCTASIISPMHVLTAAHCFRFGALRPAFTAAMTNNTGIFYNLNDIGTGVYGHVQVGSANLLSGNAITVNVSRVALAPGFPFPNGYPTSPVSNQAFVNNNPLDWEKDLIVLELAEPLNFTDTVAPIQLLTEAGYNKIPSDVSDNAIMVGYGGNDSYNARYGFFKIACDEVCSLGAMEYYDFWNNKVNVWHYPNPTPFDNDMLGQVGENMTQALGEGLICGTPNPSNMEGGNSGGPAVVQSKKGNFYQVGVISNNFDKNLAYSNLRVEAFIFTRVSANCEWINQLTNGLVKCNFYK